jgi:fructose-specific phosphotransferase system IIC component
MAQAEATPVRLAPLWRAVVETGFIIFLFYSNLLMGEYTRSGAARGKTLPEAIGDILTLDNFIIAIISALIGYVVVEYLRKKL